MFLWRKKRVSNGNRKVYCREVLKLYNPDSADLEYCTNLIRTSHYTWYNFLPKNLFEQLHNLANFYFLCAAMVRMFTIAYISVWSLLAPLLVVMATCMCKDIIQDIFRHRYDKDWNNAIFDVLTIEPHLSLIHWSPRRSRDIRVGDIIRCTTAQSIPADMILLSSGNGSDMEVNVSTANLDGETDRKKFFAVSSTQSLFLDFFTKLPMTEVAEDELQKLAKKIHIMVECQPPILDINTFEGRLSTNETKNVPLDVTNLVLRGCKLYTPDAVIGLVIYTGKETKLSLNSQKGKRKYSTRESRSNLILFAFVIAMVVISIILTVGYAVWNRYIAHGSIWYFHIPEQSFWEIMNNFFRFIFLIGFIIPISLLVTTELQQLFLALSISKDRKMYCQETDLSTKVNAIHLVDECSQIDYLVCDKTGTLTQNMMHLRFGAMLPEDRLIDFETQWFDNEAPDTDGDKTWKKSFIDNMVIMALCHTVYVDDEETTKENGGRLRYKGRSVDEIAIVEGAARQGIVFTGSRHEADGLSADCKLIRDCTDQSGTHSKVDEYHVGAVLEFTSERKRMSIMVRHPDGTYRIHSKGAESVMLSRESLAPNDTSLATRAQDHVNSFSSQGYRILVYATRVVSKEQYDNLIEQLKDAQGRIGQERHEAIERVYGLIETDLSPIFVTAVSDPLQQGVEETMRNVREAGIKLWVLTGDNEQTAVSVSHQAGHFSSGARLLHLTHCKNAETTAQKLFQLLQDLSESPASDKLPQVSMKQLAMEDTMDRGNPLAEKPGYGGLVVDGNTLTFLLQGRLRSLFMELCLKANNVLCCRMAPLQKSLMVRLIQEEGGVAAHEKRHPVCAAVGDGGNDVAMLLQADIGVGIYGKEGLEASRAADFSIPLFRHLNRLLFVHGHWNYHRLSNTMNLFYFKCCALIVTQVCLNFHCGLSQMLNIGGILLVCYNLTMTALMFMLYGMFERHLSAEQLISRPYLHKQICRQANLSLWYIICWLLDGCWHGIVSFYVAYFCLGGGAGYAPAFLSNGPSSIVPMDFDSMGYAVYVMLWISVTLRLLLWWRDLNFLVLLSGIATACNVVIFVLAEKDIFLAIAPNSAFWFCLILSVSLCCLPDFLWRLCSDRWWTIQLEQRGKPTENGMA